jgi:hypothetical protein
MLAGQGRTRLSIEGGIRGNQQRLVCPKCGKVFFAWRPDELPGQKIKCYFCRFEFADEAAQRPVPTPIAKPAPTPAAEPAPEAVAAAPSAEPAPEATVAAAVPEPPAEPPST